MNPTLYDKNHILSIRLSADGFSFSMLDPSGKQPFLYTPVPVDPSISLTANIKQTLAHNEVLCGNTARTVILLDTPRWTVVPLELFEDDHAETLYKQCHHVVGGEKILYNILDRTNAVIVFAMEQAAWQLTQELWPGAYVYASVSPIINHLTLKAKPLVPTTNRKMYVHQGRRSVDIVVLDHATPLLVNTFSSRNVADSSYYVLNLWKQLELNQLADELYLIGGAPANEELATLLRTYVKTVVVVNPKAEFNRSEMAACEGVPYDMLAFLHSNP